MNHGLMSRRRAQILGVGLMAALALAACGSSSSGSGTGGSSDSGKIAVSLITKDSTNPFFVAMQVGAKKAGAEAGVDVTIASGKAEGDDQGQIDAIENAVSAKQKGNSYNTGVTLIAKTPQAGVESKDPQFGLDNAWG